MPAWLIPAIKAVLPHVGTIVSAARPVFTRKSGAADAGTLQQQITELQTAASANDAHIRELAEQIKATVEALQQMALAEANQQRLKWLCFLAFALSVAALGVAMWVAFGV